MSTVHVRYFAQASRLAGTDREELAWSGGTVGELADEILRRHPSLAVLRSTWLLALDERLVEVDEVVGAGGTLAVMPPFSGG